MRKYEVSYLDRSHQEVSVSRLAPATALFEAPFMGFARGTLMATPEGPVAIEDIHPGMSVSTVDRGPQTVLWRGSTTVVPGAAGQSEESGRLTRIPADAMGLHRPSHDLLLGYGARVFRANRGHMVPATDLIDGETAIPVSPPSPVHVFHVLLERHACIKACGIEVESFHPGATLRSLVQRDIRALYLSLFPHMAGLDGFGPVRIPRLDEDEAGAA
ncbi:MAG: Hint domain-containing protein [Pseudomonadota bacterium]